MKTARNTKGEAARKRRTEMAAAKRLTDGCKAWGQLGDGATGRERQLAIIRELVETRTSELRLAYPDLQAIGAGLGTRKGRDSETPCVMFLVARKKKRVSPRHTLPSHLFAHLDIRGRRTLCAVPTDVEEQHAYRFVRAQSGQIGVVSGSVGPIWGVATTPVRIRFDGALDQRIYVLSCLHVLGMAQEFFPALGSNCRFHSRGTDQAIGELSGYRGQVLSETEGDSFDAALAMLDDDDEAAAKLRGVLPDNRPRNRIQKPEELPPDAIILSPRRAIPARRRTDWIEDSVRLQYGKPGKCFVVHHRNLVEWDANTVKGDSGSPVVSATDPDLLLGMHIAGDEKGTAFMIPAYNLFDPIQFGLNENDSLTIPTKL